MVVYDGEGNVYYYCDCCDKLIEEDCDEFGKLHYCTDCLKMFEDQNDVDDSIV